MLFFPPSTSRVQGIAGAWEKCGWLIDQQDYFQLEFFEFLQPRTRPRTEPRAASELGYNMIGIVVNDFDQALTNFTSLSARPKPAVIGADGARRACLQDPEGNWVEVFECDPLVSIDGAQAALSRPQVPALVRTMRASVPCLQRARETFVDALGLVVVEGFELHADADEARWGLAGATAERLLVRSGNFLLELVQYQSPAAPAWPPDYSLADQGFMNIALGYSSRADFDDSFGRALQHGMSPNGKVLDIGIFRVMYVNDPAGFSVEMLYARKPFWTLSGFNPREAYVEIEMDIAAPRATVWHALTDHASISDWSPFDCNVLLNGQSQAAGIGCVRELSAAGVGLSEEIFAWEEGAHYAYRLLSGAPFSAYTGAVYLSDCDAGSRVRWALRLRSPIPGFGALSACLIRFMLQRALTRLKRQLECGPV